MVVTVKFTCGGIFHNAYLYQNKLSKVRSDREIFDNVESAIDLIYRMSYIITAPVSLIVAAFVPICNHLANLKLHLVMACLVVLPCVDSVGDLERTQISNPFITIELVSIASYPRLCIAQESCVIFRLI